MTDQRLLEDPSSDEFLDSVRSIESDNIRERVERIPDGRVQHFLVYRYRQDRADSTVANDCYQLRLYCGFLENRDVELEKVEREDARAFLRQCAEYGRSVGTLETYRVTVRQLHAHLWREFDITSLRPTEIRDIDLTRIRESVVFHGIHPAEVRRLCRAAKSHRNALMIRTAHEAGVTSEEIRSLTVSDFERDARVLSVPGKDGTRRVPLLEALATDMAAWIEDEHPDHSNPDAPLFPSRDGSHIQSHVIFFRAVRDAAERARLRTPNTPVHRPDRRRLSPMALWKSGRDRWRLDGVPDKVCTYLQQPQGADDSSPSISEEHAFDLFRENFDPQP